LEGAWELLWRLELPWNDNTLHYLSKLLFLSVSFVGRVGFSSLRCGSKCFNPVVQISDDLEFDSVVSKFLQCFALQILLFI
jgi:hypothetical protein